MATLSMVVEVKHMDEMSDTELNDFLHQKLDQGKSGLLQFVWQMTNGLPRGNEILNRINMYISSDEDANFFLKEFWDGNIDDFEECVNQYIEWLYSQVDYN